MPSWTMTRRAIAAVACTGLVATVTVAAVTPASAEDGPVGGPLGSATSKTVKTTKRAVPASAADSLVAGVVYRVSGLASISSGTAASQAASSVRAALVASGARLAEGAHAVDGGASWAVDFDKPLTAKAAASKIAAVEALPGVTDVEANNIATADANAPVNPSDPYLRDYQWSIWDYIEPGKVDGITFPKGGYSSHALSLWPATKGKSSVVVAVLDTGQTTHPQLTKATVAGYDFISSKASARDGSGRDSNPKDQGDWTSSSDSSWHGTHVAGIVAAAHDGKEGIGNAPGLRVQHVRVLGRDGGTSADIAAAITWASGGSVSGTSKNKTPAKVINLSLGGRHSCESFMQKAIDGARKRGSVVVVSAGNSNQSALKFSPASCKNVITVAATDRAGERASYSNYGSAVEIAAPGGDYGALVASTWNNGRTTPGSATWATMGGTSQAAPAVSAAAGLLASLGLSRSQIEKGIVKAVSTFPKYPSSPSWSCRGKCGSGYLDLQKVLAPKSRVTISGTVKVGSTLTAKSSYTGKISSRTYTWYRSGKVISGATGSTYKLKSADKGKTIKVKVTPKGSGSYLGITSTSASTSTVR